MLTSPSVGSLFTGIGGIDLGLERAGFRVAWMCERDEYCQRVLAQHWPGVPIYDDATNLPDDVERVDVITAGFPCQPVSYAGRRKAQDDERWLWPYVEDIIRALRPRGVLLENVPGLFTAGFDDVIGGLAACGYDAEWDCIPAAAVGAPHRRDRVFIIAAPCNAAQDSTNGGWDDPMAHASGEGPFRPIREVVEGQAGGSGQPDVAGPRSGRGDTPVSHTAGAGPQGHRRPKQRQESGHLAPRGASDGQVKALANSNSVRVERSRAEQPTARTIGTRKVVADSSGVGQPRQGEPIHTSHSAADGEGQAGKPVHDGVGEIWPPEPDVGRVADGIPHRVDRLRALGNAVVPQVAEYVGHQLARMMGVRDA